MCLEENSALNERNALTNQLNETPYDCGCYLQRALCYERLGFPDLAAGDAYRALLLTDELQDESGEYHEQAVEQIQKFLEREGERDVDEIRLVGHHVDRPPGEAEDPACSSNEHASQVDNGVESAYEAVAQEYARKTFIVLTRSLSKCGCLNSAYEISHRGLKAFPGHHELQELQEHTVETYCQSRLKQDPAWDRATFDPKTDLPEQGFVRRELYPWNGYEPDRFSQLSLSFLNSEMRKVAPKCEVLAVSLPVLQECSSQDSPINSSMPTPKIQQLGIFATDDIAPKEAILHESSLLTASNRLYDPLCDACSSPLPPISRNHPPLPSCPFCDDTVFCSESCYIAAQKRYHPAICEKSDFDVGAKDPSPRAASNALYLLLLARAIALSSTQNIHPLDLSETKYLWGDFVSEDITYAHSSSASQFSIARHLPFTFHDNILAPLHLLEKMDIDIFASLARCDTWVINTLFAKFRATASARLSTRDGKPEVCAVHPLWCLANHSCAPNVRWEWGGEIKFEARGERDVEAWQGMGGREWGKGIKKGEEVLNHYCDVELKVAERREWAAGALGGVCVCERCVWEDKINNEVEV